MSTKQEGNKPRFYVGVGASAGGLEALEALFADMPTHTGMAFVVVQHLSPDYKSLMVELLSKRTQMSVQRAEEGVFVEPDTIYLIPPRKNLSIFHGKLLLSEQDHQRGLNLPIDHFLYSLAADQGENTVAIILSGTGSDGARGLRAVKEAGGLVLVQSCETARFDGMPRSAIDTGLADLVLPPGEMPEKLVLITNPPYGVGAQRPQAILSDEEGLTRIFALLRERNGLDFTFYKPHTVLRRIERRMSVNQAEDLRDYVRLIEQHPGEVETLYRDMLIGVTSFFRDREVFEELQRRYMPELLATAKGEVRFWVAGCSTGEEAYTRAMIVREVMEAMKQRVAVKIFATDVDRLAIQQASNGVYPASIAADVPAELLGKYFLHRQDHYRIHRDIREMVVFAQHNLIKDPPFTNISLVSCRNLLIYLQPVLQNKVLEMINFSLNAGGIYLMGSSETTGDLSDYFEPLNHKFKLFRARGKRVARPDGAGFLPFAGPRSWNSSRQDVPGSPGAFRRPVDERYLERFLEGLAGEHVALAVLVNEAMEVLHIVGDPTGVLQVSPGRLLNDVTRMVVRELAIPLATGIQKVFKNGNELTYPHIGITRGEQHLRVTMRIKCLPGKGGQAPLAIAFMDQHAARPSEEREGADNVYDASGEAEQRIRDLEQDLQFNRENLQATIEELETSNEELQATNEELLASNEELQSTNEELQSVNEELHTVNAEYQIKITELTELNNDLDNFLGSTGIGALFLDENLEIRKYTPMLADVFNILHSDLGRPANHLTHKLRDLDPFEVIKRVEQAGQGEEHEVQTLEGAWYLMRVLPYRIGTQSTSGFLLTFIDIAPVKRAESNLENDRAQLLSLFDSIGHIIYVADMDTYEVLYANKACRDAFGQDVVGRRCHEVLQHNRLPCDFCTNDTIRELDYAPYEWEYYNPLSDAYYQIIDRVIRWPDGRDVRFEMAIDVTEGKRSQASLKRMTDLLNATQQLTHVGGWEWDVEKQAMFWTDETYRIHGFEPDAFDPGSPEHIEKSLACYAPEARPLVEKAFRQCVEEATPYELELAFVNSRGRSMTIRTTGHAVSWEGRTVKVRGTIMDVTGTTRKDEAEARNEA